MSEKKYSFKRLIKSFGFAFAGIKEGYKAGQNIIIMTILGVLALVLSFVFNINLEQKLVILLLIGIILPLELINTSIEAVVDLHDKDKKSECGRIAKDCAAGALTIASIIAATINEIKYIRRLVFQFPFEIFVKTSDLFSPLKGKLPVIIVYNITPIDQTSLL